MSNYSQLRDFFKEGFEKIYAEHGPRLRSEKKADSPLIKALDKLSAMRKNARKTAKKDPYEPVKAFMFLIKQCKACSGTEGWLFKRDDRFVIALKNLLTGFEAKLKELQIEIPSVDKTSFSANKIDFLVENFNTLRDEKTASKDTTVVALKNKYPTLKNSDMTPSDLQFIFQLAALINARKDRKASSTETSRLGKALASQIALLLAPLQTRLAQLDGLPITYSAPTSTLETTPEADFKKYLTRDGNLEGVFQQRFIVWKRLDQYYKANKENRDVLTIINTCNERLIFKNTYSLRDILDHVETTWGEKQPSIVAKIKKCFTKPTSEGVPNSSPLEKDEFKHSSKLAEETLPFREIQAFGAFVSKTHPKYSGFLPENPELLTKLNMLAKTKMDAATTPLSTPAPAKYAK